MTDESSDLLRHDLFAQLAEPFTGEALFDCLPDLVFFIKNRSGRYVVVNQTLITRCGCRSKADLIGRRADEVFPAPLGQGYREQDEQVLEAGEPVLNRLELHFYPAGGRGWCVTNKIPLRGRAGKVAGLVGISKDIHPANERGEDFSQIARVMDHVQSHLDQPLKVSELAVQAGLSTYQFEQRIHKIHHLTAGQLIQKLRMDSALRRLRDSEDAIALVAQDVGYSDQSAFTRQFRQTIGMSPSEYRKTAR